MRIPNIMHYPNLVNRTKGWPLFEWVEGETLDDSIERFLIYTGTIHNQPHSDVSKETMILCIVHNTTFKLAGSEQALKDWQQIIELLDYRDRRFWNTTGIYSRMYFNEHGLLPDISYDPEEPRVYTYMNGLTGDEFETYKDVLDIYKVKTVELSKYWNALEFVEYIARWTSFDENSSINQKTRDPLSRYIRFIKPVLGPDLKNILLDSRHIQAYIEMADTNCDLPAERRMLDIYRTYTHEGIESKQHIIEAYLYLAIEHLRLNVAKFHNSTFRWTAEIGAYEDELILFSSELEQRISYEKMKELKSIMLLTNMADGTQVLSSIRMLDELGSNTDKIVSYELPTEEM